MPGFTDLHCHGGAGYEFVDGAEESVRRACEIHARNGTRVLYPTISAMDFVTTYRALEVVERALDDMYVEAVRDGCHLPPELLRLIVKLKGSGRVCLITDTIRHAGMDNCDLVQGGTERVPYIIEDGVAKLAQRSAFAGSIATTQRLLHCAVEAGIALEEAVRMLTQTPAEVMRLEQKGRIAPGSMRSSPCLTGI